MKTVSIRAITLNLLRPHCMILLHLLLLLPLLSCQPGVENGRLGMVSSQHPIASEIGLSILEKGGNAVDAAVATAFALGVVEPYHSGIGGGSFILIRIAETGETIAIDARERAPSSASRNMYQEHGDVIQGLSSRGPLSVGVPGTVAGLTLALEKYGTMSLEEVMAPSIEVAEKGVEVDPFFHNVLEEKIDLLQRFPETSSIYLLSGVRPHEEGYQLPEKDLADTYRRIAAGGRNEFYRGEIARKIVEHLNELGGIISSDDLRDYRPVEREPIRGTYKGYDILSMSPPSSGGVHLVQILNILERFDFSGYSPRSPYYIQRLAEAMSKAFEDRANLLGDADFVEVPVDRLTSKEYASEQREDIQSGMREGVGENGSPGREGGGTSHLSVIDRSGNVVSLTQTINLWFGSGITVPGTGIILNDEMDDFSAMPGVPNEFGLVGSEANSIEPGKRPLSSMSPTIILKDGRPFLVLGSRGGPRIITSVLQVVLNVIDFDMSLRKAIEEPRVHYQWLPDILYVENSIPGTTRREMERRGYSVEVKEEGIGCVSAVLVDGETFQGVSDPRGIGEARGY